MTQAIFCKDLIDSALCVAMLYRYFSGIGICGGSFQKSVQ